MNGLFILFLSICVWKLNIQPIYHLICKEAVNKNRLREELDCLYHGCP